MLAVAAVGILHTMVPDHWAPIAVMARQQGWSRAETIRAAAGAGTGHVTSTLVLGLIVWLAGIAVAKRFGGWLEIASSVALIVFGGWIAISSLLEMRREAAHRHQHEHGHPHTHDHGDHAQDRRGRMTLLLILGSSPMIEGLPAFFAAGRYGPGLIVVMSAVFAASTIATYVVLCGISAAGLQRLSLGPLERYGEVLSGTIIVVIGFVFWIWPAL